ncbi:unnamed protein product [Triticum turgidum subsp. durum]|uniref:Protein kinase domain-containing protein n=1 Tax=Triticum turgidum subsp. durum TaxID=4567 RepID=A0A9R0Q6R1_TRITD|nr:unnamed protein product [Triticum turgidum subsp. durum]
MAGGSMGYRGHGSCRGDGGVGGVGPGGVPRRAGRAGGAARRAALGQGPALQLDGPAVPRRAEPSLRDNAIHGALPGLAGLDRLRVIDLSSNRFSGPIPRRYAAALPALTRLELQDNLLNGTVPAFAQGELTVFNVSYNFLQGERLRNMGHVPRKDFAHTMQLLGKLRHENVVEVVACYHSKEEKLAVYEHVPGRSLFELLHENRGEGRMPLPWPARLSIAKGMARGLAYLHRTMPFFHRPPHGNLKSSNVIILSTPSGKHQHPHVVPKLTDYGFHPLLPHHAHRLAAAKCPEYARGKRPSSRADVFCFGLVLLEVVTGKLPVDEADGDMAEWARLALSHEWSTDILDVEIVGELERHGDMLRLTEVALMCAAVEPDRRPKMPDVVRMIDEIGGGVEEKGRWELVVG